jgi:phospholipid/cholesterol/gamma-HCH transport system substrate-binding protein
MNSTVKVGLFMTLALVVLGYLILRVEQFNIFKPRGHEYMAEFASVAGLDDQAAVRVAGVRVGRVSGIDLSGRQARVRLIIERKVGVTQGSYAEIRNMGLLGDKYVELVPGDARAAELPDGATIRGHPAVSIDEVITSVGGLGNTMQELAAQLAGKAPVEGPLGRLVVNLEVTSAQLREMLAANRGNLDTTMSNFRSASDTLAKELPMVSAQLTALLGEVRAVVAEDRGSLHQGLGNVEKLTDNLQTSVDNLNLITGRLARGEGTMGKLLTSDQTHEELVKTLESVQSGVSSLQTSLDKVNKMQLEVAMQGFYLENGQGQAGGEQNSHSDLMVDLDPQSGHLYRIGFSSDPRGAVRRKTEVVTVTGPNGTAQTTTEKLTTEDKILTSAMFGFPVGEKYRLWAGLIESTFGVEADYRPKDPWGLNLQLFDFNRPDQSNPHLRLTGRWNPYEHIYVLGGYDDPFSKHANSFFVGAGLRWRDDDLKYLLGTATKF